MISLEVVLSVAGFVVVVGAVTEEVVEAEEVTVGDVVRAPRTRVSPYGHPQNWHLVDAFVDAFIPQRLHFGNSETGGAIGPDSFVSFVTKGWSKGFPQNLHLLDDNSPHAPHRSHLGSLVGGTVTGPSVGFVETVKGLLKLCPQELQNE